MCMSCEITMKYSSVWEWIMIWDIALHWSEIYSIVLNYVSFISYLAPTILGTDQCWLQYRRAKKSKPVDQLEQLKFIRLPENMNKKWITIQFTVRQESWYNLIQFLLNMLGFLKRRQLWWLTLIQLYSTLPLWIAYIIIMPFGIENGRSSHLRHI